MKRLAIKFGILMVLLALAGVLTLVAEVTSPDNPGEASPDEPVEAVLGKSAEAQSSEGAGASASSEAEPAPSLPQSVTQAIRGEIARIDARMRWLVSSLMEGEPIMLNNAPITQGQAEAVVVAESDFNARVTYVDQRKLLPAGCEMVAVSVAMKAEGFDVSATELADKHLKYGNSVAHEYRGSPYVNGGGLPPCIVDAANSWLAANGGGARAYNLTGTSFDGLLKLVQRGYPLVVWTTENMGDPRFVGKVEDGLQWYTSEHSVVLYGVEGNEVLVSDSLQGLVKRDKERFAKIYEQVGRKSMFVLPDASPLKVGRVSDSTR